MKEIGKLFQATDMPVAYGIAYLTRSAALPHGRQECIFISLLSSWLIVRWLRQFSISKAVGKRRLRHLCSNIIFELCVHVFKVLEKWK